MGRPSNTQDTGSRAKQTHYHAPPPPTPSQQEWLAKAIHARGSLDPSGDALLEAVTGSKLQPSILLNHLRAKYAALYKLPAQQQT